tara:strand:+ start:2390 stop:2599 length:210 start_codon:yes stop_codon:yes gene_type:complete
MNMEKKYTVTEKELRAFYDANKRPIDALWERLLEYEEEHIIENLWDDNIGSSFVFLLESLRLRNGDEEE